MSREKVKVVAVTGASGYIAAWLVKLLLERGYTVKASVRDPNNSEKIKHLLALDGATERLHLFQADLLEEGSFDQIVEGCIGVFHTASPVQVFASNPQAELLDPAIKGTLNVLRSCTRAKSIKRVILTSSISAITFNPEIKADMIVDESWFSDPSFCEEHKLWYILSKTLAEEAAWKFTKENGIEMVAINPGLVIGPLLQPVVSLSVGMVASLLNEEEPYPNLTLRWVDVRDVACAHILAFETPSPSGRYCLVATSAHPSEAIETLRQFYPDIQFANKSFNYPYTQPNYAISSERAEKLGVKFIPLEKSLKDTVESLKEKKLITLSSPNY